MCAQYGHLSLEGSQGRKSRTRQWAAQASVTKFKQVQGSIQQHDDIKETVLAQTPGQAGIDAQHQAQTYGG